jgi:hypothetical protein
LLIERHELDLCIDIDRGPTGYDDPSRATIATTLAGRGYYGTPGPSDPVLASDNVSGRAIATDGRC